MMPLFVVPGTVNTVTLPRRYDWCNGQSKYLKPDIGWQPAADAIKPQLANKLTAALQESEFSDDSMMCMNVTGETFGKLIMELRDDALVYAQSRRAELLRWDDQAQQRTKKWFNSSDDEIRLFLLPRLDSVIRVLRELTPKHFLDYTDENMKATTCTKSASNSEEANAAACSRDTNEHRIFINTPFFSKPKYGVTFGTKKFDGRDSQLLILIHEVTHFQDVASSTDDYYGPASALMHSRSIGARHNADNLACYILGMNVSSYGGNAV